MLKSLDVAVEDVRSVACSSVGFFTRRQCAASPAPSDPRAPVPTTAQEAFQIVFLLRMSPVMPFGLASLLLALTSVPECELRLPDATATAPLRAASGRQSATRSAAAGHLRRISARSLPHRTLTSSRPLALSPRVPAVSFTCGTFLGVLPASIPYAYAGALAGSLAFAGVRLPYPRPPARPPKQKARPPRSPQSGAELARTRPARSRSRRGMAASSKP